MANPRPGLARQALEAVARDAPGLDGRDRPYRRGAFSKEHAELAESGRCKDRPHRSIGSVRSNAHLDRAAREQIEGVGDLSLAHDDLTWCKMRVLAEADESRDIDAIEVVQEVDAS